MDNHGTMWWITLLAYTMCGCKLSFSQYSEEFRTLGPSLDLSDTVCASRQRTLQGRTFWGPICDCRLTMNQLLLVNCANRSLTAMPTELPHNTSILFIQQNGIQEIPSNAFQSTPNISILYLHDNELQSIEDQSLVNLQQLRILNIAGNPIPRISPTPFVLLPRLREIVLTDTVLRCDCEEYRLRQWARRSNVIITGAICRNYNLHNLRTLPDSTFSKCEDYEQRCHSCPEEHSVEDCFQENNEVICSGGDVCVSSVVVRGGFPRVTGGCEDVGRCVGATNANSHFCLSDVFDTQCNFCCAGQGCQDRLAMTGLQFLGDYELSFVLGRRFDDSLHVESSVSRRMLTQQIVRELGLVFAEIGGTFEVVVNSFDADIADGGTRVSSRVKARLSLRANVARIRDDLDTRLRAAIADAAITLNIHPSSIHVSVEGVCSSSSTTSRDHGQVTWPSTFIGKEARVTCPWDPFNIKIATRQCHNLKGVAHWAPADYSGCLKITPRFKLLANITSQPVTDETVRDITNALANATENPATINAKEIQLATQTITNVVGAEDLTLDQRSAGYILRAVCNMLRVDLATLVTSELLYGSTSSLLRDMDGLSHQMEPLDPGYVLHFTDPAMHVAMVRTPSDPRVGITFRVDEETGRIVVEEVRNTSSAAGEMSYGSIVLPPATFHSPTRRDANVQFALYGNDKFFKAVTLARRQPLSQEDVSDLDLSERLEDRVNSRVISASISKGAVTNLARPAAITLQHTKWRTANARCAFWNMSLHDGRGDWSSVGMLRGTVDPEHYTVCYSHHLTNFALLMDIYGTGAELSSGHQTALSVISYIGCAISLIGLSLTLVTYLVFKQLRKDNPSKILVNLCAALLLLVLAFIIASAPSVVHSPVACKIFGFVLHYVVLSALGWMCVEALYMYLALVKVFQTYYSRFLLKCAALGWGIPFVIAFITLCVSTDNYGPQGGLCWLSRTPFFCAFLPPVCMALGFNFTIFGLVIKQLYTIHSSRADNNKYKYSQIATRMRGACSIVVLLGLTWVFGFFAIGGAGVVFQYLFALCNSLQGLFIFVFYCILKKDVKYMWMRTLPWFDLPPDASTTSRAPTGATVLLNASRESSSLSRHARKVSEPLHSPCNDTRQT